MKLKRFLTALAAMTMLMTAFTGCNKDNDSSSSESSSSQADETQSSEESASGDSDVSGQTIYRLRPQS